MAKKKEIETKVEMPEEKPSFFPKLLILFSAVLIALAIINFFSLLAIPELATNIILFLAGLWMLKLGFEKGFGRKRKEILKKYI